MSERVLGRGEMAFHASAPAATPTPEALVQAKRIIHDAMDLGMSFTRGDAINREGFLKAELVASIHNLALALTGHPSEPAVAVAHPECHPAALCDGPEQAREWREGLWLGHGHTGLYGDDGERQCARCMVDYKRDPPARIIAAITGVLRESARAYAEHLTLCTEAQAKATRERHELEDQIARQGRASEQLDKAHDEQEAVIRSGAAAIQGQCTEIERLQQIVRFLTLGLSDMHTWTVAEIKARAAAQGEPE